MSLKNILLNCVVLIVSVLFVLSGLELAVRIIYPQSQYAIQNSPWGFSHIPNAGITYYGERGERGGIPRHPVSIRYNSKGLRDHEYGYEKPAGSFRILVLGDSWAEDMGSYFENLHAKRLEKKLNALDPSVKYEVINAGHYAYDDAQELMYFMLEGRKYHPDLVIVMYSGDTAEAKYATLEDGKLKLHFQTFTMQQRIRRGIVSFLRKNSHLGTLILDRITCLQGFNDLLVKLHLKEENCYAVFPKGHPMVSDISEGEVAKKVTHEGEDDDLKETDKQIFLSLKNEVEGAGGKLIIMPVYQISARRTGFFKENGFYVLQADIDFEKMAERRKNDMKNGTYDTALESHRFGYKSNEPVAQQMLDYLIRNKLIPYDKNKG